MAWLNEVRRGDVVWADLSPTRGREQDGQRPALIIASNEYLKSVPHMVIVLPVTTADRGWPHHVQLTGPELKLSRASWVLTEQPRAISRDRLTGAAGRIDADCMSKITDWLRDFLGLY